MSHFEMAQDCLKLIPVNKEFNNRAVQTSIQDTLKMQSAFIGHTTNITHADPRLFFDLPEL